MQSWARANNERVLILFEGQTRQVRAGHQRMLCLSPATRHVALQAYRRGTRPWFQRYVEQLPTHGDAFFDALVQPGRGQASWAYDHEEIARSSIRWCRSKFLVNDGIHREGVALGGAEGD
jgi:hypothetical protein